MLCMHNITQGGSGSPAYEDGFGCVVTLEPLMPHCPSIQVMSVR
jgi:hypothetical protein